MYIKSVLLLFFIFIEGGFLIAQNIEFNKAFPISPYSDSWSFSIQDAPGGYIVYGITVDSTNHQDPAITKIDSAGNILWQKSYHKVGYDFIPFGTNNELGVLSPSGGGLEVITWQNDTSSQTDYWGLYRFDQNGDTLWTKNNRDTTSFFIDEIKATRNKTNLIFGCWTNWSDQNYTMCTLFLRKTDSMGNEIWRRTYHNTINSTREPSGIDTCKDGGYILCAYENDTIANYSKLACQNGEIVIMKTDSSGNIQWVKYITNPLCDVHAFSIRTLKNGGYAVCGFWDDSLNWNGAIAFSHIYLAKLNDTGNMIWNKTYGVHNISGYDGLYNLREMPNGDIVSCGYGDTINEAEPGSILRTDSNGNQKWLKYYYKFYPGDADYLTDILVTRDGGFISSGWTFSSPPYIWVVKTDSLGCDTIGCNYSTGVGVVKEESGGVKVYPNPNNGSFRISLSNINDKCNVEIYNVLGERVYKATLNSANTKINLSEQSAGVYFYRVIKEDGGLIGSGKLISEK